MKKGSPNAILPRQPFSGPPSVGWAARVFWGVTIVVVTLALLSVTWSVITVLFASAVLAYLLDPLLGRLQARGLSRDLSMGLLAALAALFGLFLLLVVLPSFVRQIAELSQNLIPYLQTFGDRLAPYEVELEERTGFHIPVDFRDLAGMAPELMKLLTPEVRVTLTGWGKTMAGGGFGVLMQVLQASLVIPFTFFLARDWRRLVAALWDLVPPRWRPTTGRLAAEIDVRIFEFVKGQLLVAGILGVIYTVGLLIAGIDLAVAVGMMSGVLFLVPYVGTIFGLVVSCILALLKFGFDWHVLMCVATFIGAQGVEGTVLTPLLVGDRVGLHPMVVIVALIVGGNLLGIWGLVLAVPLTAALAVMGAELLVRYRGSQFYG